MDGSIHGGGTACSPNSREPEIPGLRPDLTGPFPTDTSSSARPGQRSGGSGKGWAHICAELSFRKWAQGEEWREWGERMMNVFVLSKGTVMLT